jgi:NAD(P)-dependent dehydrogenase (short-subunit alcohol dehydrogenase family)
MGIERAVADPGPGRIGRPEDVADAVAFLLGNGFVNGETIVRDGGARWAS